MPTSFLYRFVDLLAAHKLNLLHLHLTDDQGWRFPSSAYPLLTEVASWRHETLLGHHGTIREGHGAFDGTPHGGYYTREELKNLVSYAAERNITIMPEVDLPGHVQAVLAAYPELGCSSEPVEVRTTWGISQYVLNLSEPAIRLCSEIIREVAEVFPSPYLHLGGDECPRDEWRTSGQVHRLITELGLADEDAFQAWFTSQMGEVVRSLGRRLVGWDEILENGEAPSGSVVMAWRSKAWGATATSAGLDAVVCPENPCYLNHYQSEDPSEPLATHGLNTLESVYAFDPLPTGVTGERAAKVLGTELLLWAPYMPAPRDVEYMAFPRGAALAEVAWSGGGRQFDEFKGRLGKHLERLDALSVEYRPLAGPLPWQRGGTGTRKAYYGPAGHPIPL